jgi:hypothetical protein
MNNIFNELLIPDDYFNFNMSFKIKYDYLYDNLENDISITTYLLSYLYHNLQDENYETLKWDLRNALTTNAK